MSKALRIVQKNGNPNHPQTQGKVERFHQTQKRWLAKQPPATTVAELQAQLDWLRQIYNEQRPHRELDRRTPSTAYTALPTTAIVRRASAHVHRSAVKVAAY
jgi:transposase InsO family protein